jgi:hypothetical protein
LIGTPKTISAIAARDEEVDHADRDVRELLADRYSSRPVGVT